jgi:hypothetical protein
VRRLGIVADAAVAVLAARLAEEMPQLPDYDLQRIAGAQVEALRTAGFRIIAPVAVLARAEPTPTGEPT